ncbi:p21-C-terminal region-binding protein-domain-containing protein [Pisolithus tinctorius]|nr:p21-C-terminal region-binding protein-domain-containing protein [Pisolithus tinctorius]
MSKLKQSSDDTTTSVDYHAINRSLVQLFGADAEGLQTGRLANLILSAADSVVGSLITKTYGEDSDPCALLTVLSCDAYRYMLSKISADPTFFSTPSLLFAPKTQVQNRAQAHLGLVLWEHMISMPVQVVSAMYHMLVDELQDAVADGDPYNFTHSRAYRLTPEEEAMAAVQKDSTLYKLVEGSELSRGRNSLCAFHPQDGRITCIAQHVPFRYRCHWKSEWSKEIPAMKGITMTPNFMQFCINRIPNTTGPVQGTVLGTPVLQQIFADFRTLVGHCPLTREPLDVS